MNPQPSALGDASETAAALPTAPRFIQLHREDHAAVRAELSAGLGLPQAQVSPKYLYDALGSRLFDAITELPEYYPTRVEAAILAQHRSELAAAVQRLVQPGFALVDLGAGNCAKAASLFPLLRPGRYVPVDISVDFLRQAVVGLKQRFAEIDMVAVGLDFSAQLSLPEGLVTQPALLFYPGSSIGNFDPAQALQLLRQAHAATHGGALLIGVDLVKPVALLEPAYDDALGVTAAFNLNLLLHLNRLIGADFDLRDWRHVAFYNAAARRIEMHVQAQRDCTLHWSGGQRRFAAGDRIHTESSYKWRADDFEALLRDAGFDQVQCFSDARQWFALFLARAGT